MFELDTPREALYFNARVKTQMGHNAANQLVNSTLSSMGISHCADTVIGTPGLVRGISGGERKRTNIGSELVTGPRVLLLDEPTTGLDSVTALRILHRLRDLAHRDGRTIICTIHQPSSEIFEVLDDLMLLANGKVIYHGVASEAQVHFASLGWELPQRHNPADFYMKLLHQSKDGIEKMSRTWQTENKIEHQVVTKDTSPEDVSHYVDSLGGSLWTQAYMLMRRSFRNMVRSPVAFYARMGQTLFFILLMGLLYLNMDNSQAGVQDRWGFLFLVVINQVMSSIMNGVIVFASERVIFLREQANSAYSPVLYAVARPLAELPLQIFFPALFSCTLYWMSGLRRDLNAFLIFVGTSILASNTAQSFGIFVAACIPDLPTAMALVPLTILPFMLASGFLANSDRLDPGFLWLNAISFIRYTFIILMKNEFIPSLKFECPPSPEPCLFRDGADVIRYFGFDEYPIWQEALILLGMMIALRAATAVALTVYARKKRGV